MKLVVGNFKMNLTKDEILEYIAFFKRENTARVIFAPSSIYLDNFIQNGLKVASQDVAFASSGAYTGDISASQLKSLGVNYSIVGHSERRKNYNDGKYVNEKIIQLLHEEIFPILCIGETKEEHEMGKTFDILKEEIQIAFKNIDTNSLNNVIIAYEPIWSIGTGVIPTNNDVFNTVAFIKKYLSDSYNISIKVLYGGSVNNETIVDLEQIDNIDGYLVGGCSIKKDEFSKLIKNIN